MALRSGRKADITRAESPMKVMELVLLLLDLEPHAEVVIAARPSVPVEHAVQGVVTRAQCGDEPEPSSLYGSPTDVLLVEGAPLRPCWRAPFDLTGGGE
jgi:hypothetical protein